MKNLINIVCFCAFFISGCAIRSNHPPDVLPESTFVAYFADSLILNEDRKFSGMDNSEWKKGVDSLRLLYNCSLKDIEASHIYFKSDLSKWESFYKNVTQRLEHLQQSQLIQNVSTEKEK
jgi:hypothetical protein